MTSEGSDLRNALDLLEQHGELSVVTGEVNWDLELGTIVREVLRRKGPALVFDNIRGYNGPGARCGRLAVSLLASHRRISLLLGFPDKVPNDQLVRYVMAKNREALAPVFVDSGPVQEHVVVGAAIDLSELPVPRWHHLDGGRYINTFASLMTRDPETGWLNVGAYRGMMVDRDKIAVQMLPAQHWGLHFAKYQAMSAPMPIACIYGWDPVMDFVAGSPYSVDTCEYDVMGAYRGRPVPVVRGKTVDLPVPASAEIVVEGFISPDPATFAMEGPFGEYTGYLGDLPVLRPVIQVTAITHRDQPIFRGTLEGSLPSASGENSYMSSIQRAATAWNVLLSQGVPGVLDVYIHPVTNGTTVVVQIKKAYEPHAKQIAAALWGTSAAMARYKYVIVVDDDVDPTDYEAIDWAIAYRVRPGTDDIIVFPSSTGSGLDPSTPVEDRAVLELGAGQWNRMLIDATKTWKFPKRPEWLNERFPPTVHNAPEQVELVRRRWQEYGFTNWRAEY